MATPWMALLQVLTPELNARWLKIHKSTITKKKTNKKIMIRAVSEGPLMPIRMWREIKKMISEDPITWLTEKELKASDVNEHLSRLFIPTSLKLERVLRGEEYEKIVVDSESKRRGGMGVKVVDEEGVVWELDFKLWKSLGKFVFTNQWREFVRKLELRERQIVQIWCFRDKESKLCFAINVQKQ